MAYATKHFIQVLADMPDGIIPKIDWALIAVVIIDDIPTSSPAATNSSARAPRILLVSAMFPLPTSKHTSDEYAAWLTHFLGRVETDIYFFTPPAFAPTVRSARPAYLPITIDTAYSTPFSVPPLKGLEEKYDEMHSKDREGFRHTPSLYAVWNAKPWLLNEALEKMRERGEVYDYAFWSDAGSFRDDHAYRAWPEPARVQEVMEDGGEEGATPRIFLPLTGVPPRTARLWREPQGPLDAEVSEGSFFGGAPAADQTLINALLLLFPERFRTVYYREALAPAHTRWPVLVPYFDAGYLGACGSECKRGGGAQMRDRWIADAIEGRSWKEKWRAWAWWRERQRCRMTRTRGLEEVFRDVFGNEWTPPPRKLVIDA
ncbi:hypothetical protein BJ912DRAFT_1023254 [Pholiota molesta]|nr:hypothetical protein BJ912DRAFT_1023254 [Pholiota molesta]